MVDPKIDRGLVRWSPILGGAMSEPIIGSEPKAFAEPKIEGSLEWWTPGLGKLVWGAHHDHLE